ncbi:unnamed protein product [Rodentolepis nana]|uniref:Uncharacterized protein n=1 Tax=Rodentolepis nana TaxID=102285 RepID=A0A0R3TD56_RODNA|nr:unnamed protein product [Rodentolepis nana]
MGLTKLNGESMRLAMTVPITTRKSQLTHQALPDQLLAASTTTGVEPGHIDPSRFTRCIADYVLHGCFPSFYMDASHLFIDIDFASNSATQAKSVWLSGTNSQTLPLSYVLAMLFDSMSFQISQNFNEHSLFPNTRNGTKWYSLYIHYI